MYQILVRWSLKVLFNITLGRVNLCLGYKVPDVVCYVASWEYGRFEEARQSEGEEIAEAKGRLVKIVKTLY